ncbi:hypothetical protein AA313_de0207152 [Arthrobotrys entomopaga]|nr:hypothetical protein AA313_de0207152 [Arthrobotrys entomopaga]
MLKTKPLNALLSQSLSEHVSSVILFTPSGNLLASSAAPNSQDAKKARVHAALAANIWSTYERVATDGLLQKSVPSQDTHNRPSAPTPAGSVTTASSLSRPGSGSRDHVKTLTVELTEYNLHIQAISPRMLLGMIGRRPDTGHPSSSSSQHSNEGSDHDPGIGTSRGAGQSLRQSGAVTGGGGGVGPASAAGSGSAAGGAMGVLKVTSQTLVDYLQKELKDFEPPEDL